MKSISTKLHELGIKKRNLELEFNKLGIQYDIKRKKIDELNASATDAESRIQKTKEKAKQLIKEKKELDNKKNVEKNKFAEQINEKKQEFISQLTTVDNISKEIIKQETYLKRLLQAVKKIEIELKETQDLLRNQKQLEKDIELKETKLKTLQSVVSLLETKQSVLEQEIHDRQKEIFVKEITLNKTIQDIRVIGRRVQGEYEKMGGKFELPIDLTIKVRPKKRSELII